MTTPRTAEGLPYPWPIPLSKYTSNFGFYCHRDDGGFCFHNFHSAYAAKKFLDVIIDDKPYRWVADDKIMLDNGITIRGERITCLEEAIEHEYTPKERAWEIPEPHITYYLQFIGKTRRLSEHTPAPQVTRSPRTPKPKSPAARPRLSEEEKVARKKMKTKTGDYVTIAQICASLGRPARDCRAALRSIKIPKPAHGWAWPRAEAAEVEKRLAKILKSKK